MSQYRRVYQRGGCYFFTVVTFKRFKFLAKPENIQRLRDAFQHVMLKYPFTIDAIVVLPNHLHCIWVLPEGDYDFSVRWRLIKRYFSMGINVPLTQRCEKKVWQRRFWEHLIRNEKDWQRHMDYIHYNPVKHGFVKKPIDWPHSSFEMAVKRGFYERDWGNNEPITIENMNYE
jgi:putative transposase